MILHTFENRNRWIEITEDFKIKVDYLTADQKYRLESIQFKNVDLNKGKLETVDVAAFTEAARYFVKFSIKDWKGLKAPSGEEIKCVLVDNELEDSLFLALIQDDWIVNLIYSKINEVLRWNESDKKKLNLSPDLETKADLKGK